MFSIGPGDGPPFGGIHHALQKPLHNLKVVVGPHPGLLESWAEILDVTLWLCQMTVKGAGHQGHHAPLVEHIGSVAWEHSTWQLKQWSGALASR